MTLIKKNLKGGWETVCAYAWRRGFTKFTRCNMGMGGNKENSCECTWMGPYMYNGSLNCIWHCNTSYKSVVWHLKKGLWNVVYTCYNNCIFIFGIENFNENSYAVCSQHNRIRVDNYSSQHDNLPKKRYYNVFTLAFTIHSLSVAEMHVKRHKSIAIKI